MPHFREEPTESTGFDKHVNIIMQMLHPMPHQIPLCLSVCPAESLQTKPMESKINPPCGLWLLTSHLGWLSCTSLQRLSSLTAEICCLCLGFMLLQIMLAFTSPVRFVIQWLSAWLTASLAKKHSPKTRNGVFIPAQLLYSMKELKCRMWLPHHCKYFQ